MKLKNLRNKNEIVCKMCSVYTLGLTLACWSKPTSQMINKNVQSKQTIRKQDDT